jgi:uncharacterized protein (TIGR00106 family)
MAMMEISVVPVGTGSPSVSEYVAGAVKMLGKASDIRYELTAMGTIIEGDLPRLLELAGMMHRSVLEAGAMRVSTSIRLDERADRPVSMEGKVEAVRERLAGG